MTPFQKTPFKISFPSDKERLNLFMNTVQLCIQTPIDDWKMQDPNTLLLFFRTAPKRDKGLDFVTKLVDGTWNEKRNILTFNNFKNISWAQLMNFLMLSRLNEENMKALAKMDAQYRPFVRKLFGGEERNTDEPLETPEQVSRFIFSCVEKQNMTLRKLADKSDLSQVSLSKFKTGNDIRLSSLLRILKALGLKITIEK
ncbi:MAG: hypothetical protein A3I05_01265 [Deltaproteobacteria bacterium RIFCSPLOWO2_02_FULL_44_10]|nr:MAG: hypothetical protein A3C46_00785 [Deltaproteobacteria bacterium RIFCSPHIGHO2_02_FULL_44_16]OGQ46946.1 MAG: hypothetical protein A3I05_01265 [Deltaproteobacteria bacterium RIFCSPLOWO2_02_FULL_44_10]